MTKYTVLAGIMAAVLLSSVFIIPNTGNIRVYGVEAYWSVSTEFPVTNLKWGTIEPNMTTRKGFYVYNPGLEPITIKISAIKWISENVTQYLHLDTHYHPDTVINPDTYYWITVSLSLDANTPYLTITDFSFDLVLEAIPVD